MTRTDFHAKMGMPDIYADSGPMKAMEPEAVVGEACRALERRRVVHVPGGNNRFFYHLCRLMPRKSLYKIVMGMVGKPAREANHV
jgi:short-subunit dehydrogenase